MIPLMRPAQPDSRLHRIARTIEVGPLLTVAPTILLLALAISVSSCDSPFHNNRDSPTRPTPQRPVPSRSAPHSTAAPTTPPRAGEPSLRIRLLAGVESATIAGPARVMVALASRSNDSQLLSTPITISRSGPVWRVEDAQRSLRAFTAVGDAELAAGLRVEPSGAAPLTLAGKPHPGQMTILPAAEQSPPPTTTTTTTTTPATTPATNAARSSTLSTSRIDLVEAIGLETYIAGVVAGELPSGWEPGALKAQAIAARSYALHERDRAQRLGRPFDLDAGESDQVYAGATTDPAILRAVSETRGSVLSFQGRTLRAYYSSTCGGRSAAAKDVWPTSAGFEFNLDAPLQGHPLDEACSISPLYRWSLTRPRDELTRRLNAFGRDTGMGVRNLKSFAAATPSLRNQQGRPTQYRIFDADGSWWPLSAEQLRSASNWTGTSGLPAGARAQRVNSGDAIFQLGPDAVTITGQGFGHGVGLCQYGAQAMAKAGKGSDEILRFYYPGATIEHAY